MKHHALSYYRQKHQRLVAHLAIIDTSILLLIMQIKQPRNIASAANMQRSAEQSSIPRMH